MKNDLSYEIKLMMMETYVEAYTAGMSMAHKVKNEGLPFPTPADLALEAYQYVQNLGIKIRRTDD